jgi:hypothetical protein
VSCTGLDIPTLFAQHIAFMLLGEVYFHVKTLLAED